MTAETGWLPLSAAQRQVWLGQSLESVRSRYKIGQYVEIEGPLDVTRLEAAVRRAFAEADAIHVRCDPERSLQLVDPRPGWDFPVTDLTSCADPAGLAEEKMRRTLAEQIDLDRGQLFASALYRVSQDIYLWFHGYHQFAMDAVSVFLMSSRVANLYSAPGSDAGAFGSLAQLVASDQRYRASDRFEADRQYWTRQLAGAPAKPARFASGTPSAAEGIIRDTGYLTRSELAELTGTSRPAHNLATAAVAATAACLHRMTGATDVVIGFPVTARSDAVLRTIPGLVSNLLPLRLAVPDGITAAELWRRSSAAIFETLKHGRYRGEDVVRDVSFSGALRDLIGPHVNVFTFRYDLRFGESRGIPRNLTPGVLDDLSVAIYDRSDGRDVAVELSAAAGLISAGELAVHQERFLAQLRSLRRRAELTTPIDHDDLLSGPGRRQALDWAGTHEDADALVPDLFEAQAGATPDATAIAEAGREFTYAELNARANQLARLLTRHGAGPEALVAVLLPRSADLVIALLAVLKAGAAYLPVNPDYPAQRIGAMLADAAPALLLTAHGVAVAGGLNWPRCLYLDDESIAGALAACPEANLADADRLAPLSARSPAYVIYTSGSTGVPKGVEVEQRSLANYLDWCQRSYPALRGHTLLHSPVSFDLTVTALFGTLTCGGCLHLAALDEDWAGWGAGRPTFLKVTPSHLTLLAELPAQCAPAAELMLGGEAVTGDLLYDWRQGHRGVDIINSYGPTETTVACADYRIPAAADLRPGPVPIGRPIRNVRCYVLDQDLMPVRPGVVGELYVAGAGVARGYRKRPGFTAERFLPDPHGQPGGRMYRTGDLAKWRVDGNLEFAGRADDQVKLRGFRVELGDVEATLASHPEVGRAAVIVREDRPGDKRLVGYVVPAGDGGVTEPELRKYAGEQLPDFMVPGAIVVLPGLPLTPNGKVDRQALPAPDQQAWRSYREPRSPQEEILCDLFAEVLGLPSVGVDDDFFALGGHSLLVIRLISRVRATLGADLAIRSVFEEPTVAGVARRLHEEHSAWSGPQPAATRPGVVPLSFAQRRLWFSYRLEGPSPTYNIPLAVRVTGPLDRAALAQALTDLTVRHEALRTTFPQIEGVARQRVLSVDDWRPELVVIELAESELDDALAEGARYSFDLATEAPIRVRLFALGPDDHALLLLLHHVAADGWSMGPLTRDLAAAYAARRDGAAPAWPPLPAQYIDYTLWQHDLLGDKADPDSRLARQLGYWRQALAGVPAELELPADRQRPAALSYRGARYRMHVDRTLHRGIADLAREAGASVFMVSQTALAALLTRMGAGTDLPMGTPVAGRTDPMLDDIVGLFVNTLVLRADTSGDPSFRELLGRVRDTDLDAYANSDIPFDYLVEVLNPARSLARNPLFHVMISFQSVPRGSIVLPGLETSLLPVRLRSARFDLSVSFKERRTGDGKPDGIDGLVEYSTDLFEEATIESLMERFVRLLEAMADNPDQPISQVSILSAAERRRLVTDWAQSDS